jgi:glutamate-1-semialdehyde 2,1-aminomutase
MIPVTPASAIDALSFSKSNEMRKRAHALIPGGCHSISKGDDQFPVLSPGFFTRGEGCRVWDVDGNCYIEYGMGLRAVTLGHAYGPVVEAAHRQMLKGANFTRPAAIELEAAETFLGTIEGAEMVKFTKNGSTATSAAVKLARAVTGRDRVAVCADHPFFSHGDWFIAVTEMNAGIPKAVRELTVSFRYNDLPSLEALFAQYPGEIACIILEGIRGEDPRDGFLHKAMDVCHRHGALFILDEMINGFRLNNGGAQKEFGIVPDLSTFGKAIANGFSVAALAGKREFMRLGGLDHERERIYLLSATHGAETHSLAAAIKTMHIYRDEPVIETMDRQGRRLAEGVTRVAAELGIHDFFQVAGRPCNLVYVTRDAEGDPSQPYRTLFMQEIVKRGVIGPSFVISAAHDDEAVDRTIEVVGEALEVYARALTDGVEPYLVGRPVKPSDRRFN